MVLLPILRQTKESVRRDKRPSSVYCMGQKHLLVGASLSTVCLYCVKHLLAYFRKHLSLCWSSFLNSCWPILKNISWPIFVSICWSSFVNSCWAICYESYHLLVRLLVT